MSFAFGSLVWAAVALKALPDDGTIEHMAERVAQGDSYELPSLQAAVDRVIAVSANTCDVRFLSDSVLIEAKAVDLAVSKNDLGALDTGLNDVGGTSARLIHCAPMSALGWLGLYWVHVLRDGYSAPDLQLLERSYSLGRRETWLAVRRNPLALAIFAEIGPELQEIVLDEFVDLVRVSRIEQTAAAFMRFDGALQKRVLARLETVPDAVRSGFFRKLRHLGFEELPPDRRHRDDSPWID